jgi:CheY-like chemotaxis protein
MARILIIDDELLVRMTLRGMLESAGHEVLEATNGREGIEQCKLNPPNLIITDLIMSEMDGFTTMLKLREHDPKMKIIAISGGMRMDGRNFLSYAKRIGASQILTKPFNRDRLLEVVEQCFRVIPFPRSRQSKPS